MTEILEQPFDKIAIDLVTECETSSSGNKHTVTIINHLTGWLEAFPIPDKSADTIVSTFINHYLPVHMYPRYILLDNGTEFKNHLMDQVLQQLSSDHIFSAPYHPQSNGKLDIFHKYVKPTLKKLCKKDPTNWDKYINQVLTSYTKPCHSRNTIFLVYGRDPNPPPHQLLEPMQWFQGDPESGLLNLEAHCLALAIAKETLDENCFTIAQKIMDREPPSFKTDNRVYFKKQITRQMGPQMETWIQDCPYWAWQTLPTHWKSSYWKNKVMQHQRCCSQTTSGILEHWHTLWQSWEIHQQPCKFANYHASQLKMNTLLMYTVTCK